MCALLLCVLTGFSRARAAEAPLPPGVQFTTSVEGITEYRLDNGLRVLLFPDESKQSVTVNVTYLVGSRHESYGETGMAHLLEHLLFKGTPTHPNIPGELSARGARSNGTTSFDRTNYFETLNANGDNLEWALRMEADRMVNSHIAKKDLDSEMTVVRNEYESGENSAGSVLMKRVHAAAFDWHNYGKLPIGNRSDIENVGIERLQQFYRTYYQPDNAVLLLAGRFDEVAALKTIADSFGRIAKPSRALPGMYTTEPTQDGERSVTVRRVGDTQILAVAFRSPPGPHADAAALDLLGHVLADTPAGRLHKALVETKLATSVGVSATKLHDAGLMMFLVELPKEGSLDKVREVLLKVIADLREHPPTQVEVERARASYVKQIELAMNGADRLGLALSSWMGMGDWRLFFLHRDRLKQVKAEEVARVAHHYLKAANRTLGYFIPEATPERAEIPAAPDLNALLKDYQGDKNLAKGEAFDPSPQNIEARTQRIDLPSGLRMGLLPKKTRGERVVAQLSLRFGDEQSLRGKNAIAALTGDMLMRGTTTLSRQQMEDELDRLRAQVTVAGDVSGAVATIETVREKLPEALRLVAQILRTPSFSAVEFEQAREQRIAAIQEQRSDPRSMAGMRFSRHLNPYPAGDVRYIPSVEEQLAALQAVQLEDVRGFHRDFYGASNSELAVVGDFDATAVSALARGLFEDWKSPRPFQRIAARYQPIAPIDEALQAPDKANAFFVSGAKLNLRDDDADYPALVLANEILGGGFLHSRLATRIRQKDGISYGVGSRLAVDAEDAVGRFTTYAIYAPQNLQRLQSAMREELERAVRDGFTQEEIDAARSGLLQRYVLNRAQDGALAGAWVRLMQIGRTPAWDAKIEEKLRALTRADVQTALQRHLDPSKFTVIKAGDFAASGKNAGAATQ